MKTPTLSDLLIRIFAVAGLCVALLWVLSCSTAAGPSDQQLQKQAEQATIQAKIAARKAAADARVAAAQAGRDARDIAAGVRQGLHQHVAGHTVNINTAGRIALEKLPGVTAPVARRIIAHRPYAHPYDVVRKGAVSASEYHRIAGDVVTR